MIGRELGVNLALIYAFLLAFGCGYNVLVGWMQARRYSEGYVSDLVVVGVGITLVPFVNLAGLFPAWQIIEFVAGGFVASGLPMLIGSRIRHAKARRNEQQSARVAE